MNWKPANNVVRERQWKFDENLMAMDQVQAQTQARIDSGQAQPMPLPALPAPIGVSPRPSMFSGLMTGASTMLNAAQFYFENTPATPRSMPTPNNPGSMSLLKMPTYRLGRTSPRPSQWD